MYIVKSVKKKEIYNDLNYEQIKYILKDLNILGKLISAKTILLAPGDKKLRKYLKGFNRIKPREKIYRLIIWDKFFELRGNYLNALFIF